MSALLPPMRPKSLLAATASVIELDRPSDVLRRAQASVDPASPQPARRSKIWEFADSLHCSIIGTCLSNAELRQVLVRLGVVGAEAADEHELHVRGVTLAGRRDVGGKLLQKALDRRHAVTIKHYAKAGDEAALGRLWSESLHKGDIPGAYWALLTHPNATAAAVKKAFQDVHMLSHLVGAANRADIRRLAQLEQDNGALNEKLQRQQLQLRDGFQARDEEIRQLKALVANRVDQPDPCATTGMAVGGEVATLRDLIADLNRKLGQETTRRRHLDQRLNSLAASLKQAEAAAQAAERERDALQRELDSIEDHVFGFPGPSTEGGKAALDLTGRTILYVGGRPRQIPQLKALVERSGAQFLHHDGGIEHSSSLLPGLVGKADVLCFPVDCVSHDAVAAIKRLCRQLEKPYRPLRTASLAALMSLLAMMADDGGVAVAAE